ncbi:microtubule-associated 10 [Labeo rohita]|uniref:Microtubule-associated 10 n=1 Tax=Labeo rohita TaxID=84645 RepID=A0A498LRN8_LABRO|nr:microtubule-associated 10 [Labeo rohita]
MSSTQETLFSLELVIDYVRFDGSRGNVLDPAVAVRFLDFPTLLIHQSKQDDLPSKSGYADLCLSPEALSEPDDEEHVKYSFHRGKSCLFKISLHSLHTHLLNTPLYAMVLDVKDEIPKLIGSSLISLAKVTEKIKVDVEKHGIGNPSAYGERLITPVCNLMGNSIGVISLAFKIVNRSNKLISTPKTPPKETDSDPFGHVIRQLPLLNALLVELSQLNVQTAQQPLSVHPNLAWLYTSAQEPSGAKPKAENQKTSPKQKLDQCKMNAIKSAKKNKEKLQPKRTLKYGLTNTFRLRLKLVKPDLPPEKDKKVQVHIPSQNSDHSDQHSTSSIHDSHLGFQRGDSRASGRPCRTSLSNGSFQHEEYQDDFTSLNTTDGYSPDPFSSPEPSRRKRNSVSSTSSSSHPSKALPVPVKAETSPQRSLKNTHVIRPRLQTSALSLYSDESEFESGRHRPGSQSSGQKTPSVRRTFGKSGSFDSDPGDKGMTFSRVSEDSDLAANNPLQKSISSSQQTDAEEERDKLGSLGLDRNYHHISELVINKLPGYTL